MVGCIALALLAAVAPDDGRRPPANPSTRVDATARATVRILPGARIRLSTAAQPEGYVMKPARITVEDGSRRDAKLVEFQ
jgi:hypothetical protein